MNWPTSGKRLTYLEKIMSMVGPKYTWIFALGFGVSFVGNIYFIKFHCMNTYYGSLACIGRRQRRKTNSLK